jgi:hypothetical protein
VWRAWLVRVTHWTLDYIDQLDQDEFVEQCQLQMALDRFVNGA